MATFGLVGSAVYIDTAYLKGLAVITMAKLDTSTEFHYLKVPACDNEKEKDKNELTLMYGYGIRHLQLIIFFFCVAVSFTAKGHLGVTIVAMTSQQNLKEDKSYNNANKTYFNYTNEIPLDEVNYTMLNVTMIQEEKHIAIGSKSREVMLNIYKTYEWPKSIQEMVLMAFFLGYCLMMFPIALVCQRWGGKVPLQISMLVNGIVSILTPWLALWGDWKAVCVCRFLQGLTQAGTFPGIQTLLAQWVPSSEIATLSSYVYTGGTIGTIIGFQLSSLLADAWGWPIVFWTIGVMCLLTFTFLTFFGATSPNHHKKISVAEKNYIMGHWDSNMTKKRRVPWKAILSSKPFWGNIATQVGSGVSVYFFLTQVPSYIHYILGVNVKSSGLISSLPYIGSLFTSTLTGIFSDYLTNRKIISIKNARRIFNTISQVGVAVSLICVSYASSTTVAVICLTACISCYVAVFSGWMVNHIDLSPNYSGTLMALGNVLMNITLLTIPVLVSHIVVDMTNVYQWRIMLYLIAGMAFTLNVIFVIFVSVDVQPWNEGDLVEPIQLTDLKLEAITEETKIDQK